MDDRILKYEGKYKPLYTFYGLFIPLQTTLSMLQIPYRIENDFLVFEHRGFSYKISATEDMHNYSANKSMVLRDSQVLGEKFFDFFTLEDEIFVEPKAFEMILTSLPSSQGQLTYTTSYFERDQTLHIVTKFPNAKTIYKNLREVYSRFEPSYYMTPMSTQDECLKKVREKALDVTKNAKTDREKAKAIHDFMSNNMLYNMDLLDPEYVLNAPDIDINAPRHDMACSALTSMKGVCVSFAMLTSELLRAVGIPTRYVTSVGSNNISQMQTFRSSTEGGHAWVEVYLDNEWLVMDTTWDSIYRIQNNKVTQLRKYNPSYFAIPYDHYIQGSGQIPEFIYSTGSSSSNPTLNSPIYWQWYWKQPFAP